VPEDIKPRERMGTLKNGGQKNMQEEEFQPWQKTHPKKNIKTAMQSRGKWRASADGDPDHVVLMVFEKGGWVKDRNKFWPKRSEKRRSEKDGHRLQST